MGIYVYYRVSEREETSLFEEMMAETVLNLKEDKDIQIQGA